MSKPGQEDTHMTAAGSEAGGAPGEQMNDESNDQSAQRVVRAHRGCVDGKPLGSLPNFGTVDTNRPLKPTVKSASNLKELYEEFKLYRKLRKQDELASNQEVGTPAYLVSSKWLKRYEEFLLYDQFDAGATEAQLRYSKDHFAKAHPGPITSQKDLCEEDTSNENLYGTGTIKQQESEYIDQYVEQRKDSRVDMAIFNEELWTFLSQRYGGDKIKRFWGRMSQGYYTRVDVRLNQLKVSFLNSQLLISGDFDKTMFKDWWTQISQQAYLKDLKWRLVDSLNSAGFNLDIDDIRLWLYNTDNTANKGDLTTQCKKVASGYKQGGTPQQSQDETAGNEEIQIENNSGIEFPGQSMEPLLNAALRVNQINLNKSQNIVVEYREGKNLPFAFKFKKGEKLVIGECEWCRSRNILRAICKCKNVKYCNESCMDKDRKFHIDKCSAQADNELNEDHDDDFTENSKQGLVGLSNLGNTCYMNSSIQCLSNTFELTKYFLEKRYKALINREYKNPLGTEGRLVQAWAKLISEMWVNNSQVVRPDLFKRILGQYNVTFDGYGQHDSQECINTILDFMSEDLYKKEKKPYVEQTESEGKSDEVASKEAWNKHILRNESIICDLFHGQFKSTLECALCKRISITFDPFLMVSLPIPNTKYEDVEGYLLQYEQNSSYQNYKIRFRINDQHNLYDLRQMMEKQYGYPAASFLICWVQDNTLKHIFNCKQSIKELTRYQRGGVMLFFQIPQDLEPTLPSIEEISKTDSNMGISSDWVKIVVHSYQSMDKFNLPRVIWARKDWSLKEVHWHVFKYFRDLFVRWLHDYKEHGNSARASQAPNYRRPGSKELLNYDQFMQMIEQDSLETQFKTFFPTLSESNWRQLLDQKMGRFNHNETPYHLKIENNRAYGGMQPCHWCNQTSCRSNCPLPYSDQLTLLDMLNKAGVDDNISFYGDNRGKHDLILDICWADTFHKNFIKHLSGMEVGQRIDGGDIDAQADEQSAINIEDCFNEFKKTEILDEDNMWYCNKCKEHVRAKKQLEIYKAPPIFIVNFKRFKQGGQSSRYLGMFGGGGGYGQKIDLDVSFPLESLDLTKHVIGHNHPHEKLIYDLYAVSNHYGNMGFGHYTAYCQNPATNQWYEFDDSRVTALNNQMVKSSICTNAAYNLFYRRRDFYAANKQQMDFDRIAIKPEMEYITKNKLD